MKKTTFLLTALLVLALFSGIATATPLPVTTDSGNFRMVNHRPTQTPAYVSNEIIVKYKDTSGAGRSAAVK